MDTYFHQDPRIQELLSQIIENIFTTCLLTGVDSEIEFQKGCQIVTKLTALLHEVPTIPPELLEDVVTQLLEQQLPDPRVIESFPTFHTTKERMVHEGVLKLDINSNTEKDLEPIQVHFSELPANYFSEQTAHSDSEFVMEQAVPAHASINIPRLNIQQSGSTVQIKINAQPTATIPDTPVKPDTSTSPQTTLVSEPPAESEPIPVPEPPAELETVFVFEPPSEPEPTPVPEEPPAEPEPVFVFEPPAEPEPILVPEPPAEPEPILVPEPPTEPEPIPDDSSNNIDTPDMLDASPIPDSHHSFPTHDLPDISDLPEPSGPSAASARTEGQSKPNVLQIAAAADADIQAKVKTKLDLESKSSSTLPAWQIYEQMLFLKRTLNNIFPRSTISWNKRLMGQTFLAQVENILIAIHDSEQPYDPEKYAQAGWKVFVCTSEDLAFPRRLERNLRQIQRSLSAATPSTQK